MINLLNNEIVIKKMKLTFLESSIVLVAVAIVLSAYLSFLSCLDVKGEMIIDKTAKEVASFKQTIKELNELIENQTVDK